MIISQIKKFVSKIIISQTSNASNIIKNIIIDRIVLILRKNKKRRIRTRFYDQKIIVKRLTNSLIAFLSEKTKSLLQRRKKINNDIKKNLARNESE